MSAPSRFVQMLSALKNELPTRSEAKKMIFKVNEVQDEEQLTDLTARTIAERRASEEGQEGLRAFLEKRAPSWRPKKS